MKRLILPALLTLLGASLATSQRPNVSLEGATVYNYEIVKIYPHDPEAYTQGLEFSDGNFFEGTGVQGRSDIRRVKLETGEVLQKVPIPPNQFGEGITLFQGKLYQLTWQSRVGYIYDAKTMKLERTFKYRTEGWGLTHNGKELILSDGTPVIYFLDAKTQRVTNQIFVTAPDGSLVNHLNELEFINGEIWANVWMTDLIARINPKTGKISSFVNLKGLLSGVLTRDSNAVLNGIAYDTTGKRLFVTGKLWSFLYEIKLKK
jgi:glutaminyl-peptide cyclotransferase